MTEPKTGWMCPQCGKAHAPHVDTCPDGGSQFAPPDFMTYRPVFTPYYPVAPAPPVQETPWKITCGDGLRNPAIAMTYAGPPHIIYNGVSPPMCVGMDARAYFN